MSQEQDKIFFRNFTLVLAFIAALMIAFYLIADIVTNKEENLEICIANQTNLDAADTDLSVSSLKNIDESAYYHFSPSMKNIFDYFAWFGCEAYEQKRKEDKKDAEKEITQFINQIGDPNLHISKVDIELFVTAVSTSPKYPVAENPEKS